MGTTFIKADFVLAELADESDLVKHIDKVSVQLFWLEYLFALSAVDVCLEPLFDTRSVKYLLALEALDSVL